MVCLEHAGKRVFLPARPLGLMLASLPQKGPAVRHGVERLTQEGWEAFALDKTPQPGDRLRIAAPPAKDMPYLRRLISKVIERVTQG
tara:strand:- start:968 stop:1228 length:261 start_codon:yes stop_codon:yes gene_type:complete